MKCTDLKRNPLLGNFVTVKDKQYRFNCKTIDCRRSVKYKLGIMKNTGDFPDCVSNRY